MSNNNKSNFEDRRTSKRKIGDKGEEIACRFLMKRGFTIVERNYLKKFGEIDIIAYKGHIYHFIEVKTVSRAYQDVIHETSDNYRPEDNVHAWKLQRLGKTIQIYLSDRKLHEIDWQFDVITVFIDKKRGIAAVHKLENLIL